MKGVRPEASGPAPQLYAADSARYTNQNRAIQLEMATLALQLLGLPDGGVHTLADVGCGSGLSSAALAGAAWVGTDITREMLQVAALEPPCRGRLALSDFCQGLPLRPACLDGAISVSAVQWLCSSASPGASIARFFAALRRSLVPGATAALQVYPHDDEQAQRLVVGARASGLHAGFFVAFPHPTPAKKYYLLLRRPDNSGAQQLQQSPQQQQQPQQQPQQGSHLGQRCCNLAWPKAGSCLLSWAAHLEQQQRSTTGLRPALERLQKEHAAAGRCVLRRLRNAESRAQADASDSGAQPGSQAAPSRTIDDLVLHVELEVPQPQLLPCGGALFVQLLAEAAELSASGEPASSAEPLLLQQRGAVAELQASAGTRAKQGSSGPSAPPAPWLQQYAAAAAAAVQHLLTGAAAGPEASSQAAGCTPAIRAAKAEDALVHARQAPLRPFAAPAAGSTLKAHQFMRLEPLEAAAPHQPEPRLQERQRQPVAAVLHVNKAAQHLALRFSCNHPSTACSACSGGGGASCGSAACCSHVARCLRAFCAAEGACAVALDAHLYPERVDATWLLFVPGLQQCERPHLAAAIQRHFA